MDFREAYPTCKRKIAQDNHYTINTEAHIKVTFNQVLMKTNNYSKDINPKILQM